jgi:hypothetical protein
MPHRLTGLIGLTSAAISSTAAAQWTVTNLHPAGFPSSVAFACEGDVQAGYTGAPGSQSSFLWRGTAASALNTTPSTAVSSYVRAYASGLFSGTINGDTVTWDSNRVVTVLSTNDDIWTSGYIRGAGGAMQVGDYGHIWHAAYWTGTPASLRVIGLGNYSTLYGTDGVQQVGMTMYPRSAALWSGSRESYVNLHPPQAGTSDARAVHSGTQVGKASINNLDHACLWRGTPASWVDLHPAEASTSICLGVFGEHQVGSAVINGVRRASYWCGTSSSWQDLSLAIPGSWGNTQASAVWTDGIWLRIVGHGRNLTSNRDEALLWTRRLRDCGTADFDGDGSPGTDSDIESFFACLAGTCCPTCYPGGADFNADGDLGTDADIESFFRVLSGQPC